ncbi:MAG: hydantoinase B/oxoprolinase family protein, partial [Pseudomonadota bacterium]
YAHIPNVPTTLALIHSASEEDGAVPKAIIHSTDREDYAKYGIETPPQGPNQRSLKEAWMRIREDGFASYPKAKDIGSRERKALVFLYGRGFGYNVPKEGRKSAIIEILKNPVALERLMRVALATCNDVANRRLVEMLQEFEMDGLESASQFILENSLRATVEKIAELPRASADGEMTIDGYNDPVRLKVRLTTEAERIVCDFEGTSGLDRNGINVPLVYTKAYACYALKCVLAPEIPNNAASLSPFVVTAPENCILNAKHPAPVALRHVTGHMIPDTVFNALDKILPDRVPAEGAGTICNFQVSLRPEQHESSDEDGRAEVLTFNSGGAGARPTADGLNATAFPSGVMTMPIEATEHTGPIVIWRKELRPDSGGAGRHRGGLGQIMEVGAREGYEFDFQAMFDRVEHPARGRRGGRNGAATTIQQDDGGTMRGKGKQYVAAGRRVELCFPGGGGYGEPASRAPEDIARDLHHEYVSPDAAARDYGLSEAEVSALLASGSADDSE